MKRAAAIALFVLAPISAATVAADEPQAPIVPSVATGPVVDGVLDDAVWQGALVVDDFVARQPVDGAAPSHRTEVRLLHTEHALYVGVRADDPHPEKIRATAMRRDDGAIQTGDQFAVAIDSFRDLRNGYWFSTNPLGIRVDTQFSDEGDRYEDAWDGIWEAAARVDANGWTAELEIPWATLRFPAGPEVVMGLNFFRRIPHSNEWLYAPAIPLVYANGTFNVSAARPYRFVGITGGSRLDVRPFALASSERVSGGERSDDGDAGLFVRTPLTRATSVAATWHADFSEIEADETQLNLTRFPLFLPEQRDFFLEGASHFEFGVPGEAELFFSRRVGLATAATGEAVPVPIEWGGKVAGRLGPAEVGVLAGTTSASPGVASERFEVARARFVLGGRSTAGVFWSRSDEPANRPHATWGADFSHFLAHEVRAHAFAAQDEVGSEAHRAWYAALSRGGERAAFELSVLDLGRGFEPAVGLVARPGTRRYEASVTLPWEPAAETSVRRYAPGFSLVRYDDHRGDGLDERSTLSFETNWKNNSRLAVAVVRRRERLTAPFRIYREIEVPAAAYDHWQTSLALSTDSSRPLSVSSELRGGGLYGGHELALDLSLAWRPSRFLLVAPAIVADRVSLPHASFDATVERLRVGVTLSPKLRFDLLGQIESERRGAGVGVRARYDVREGTRVVLAWDSVEIRDTATALPAPVATTTRRQSGTLKVSYLVLL